MASLLRVPANLYYILIASNGLNLYPRPLFVTCKNHSVVLISLCQSNFCINTTSVPLSNKCVAKLCRSMHLAFLNIPANLYAIILEVKRLIGKIAKNQSNLIPICTLKRNSFYK